MKYFEDALVFESEMNKILEILEFKGFIIEADHFYAYLMQYETAFDDIKKWVEKKGYKGNLETMGVFDSQAGAAYGFYDTNKISYKKMQEKLYEEVKRQSKEY